MRRILTVLATGLAMMLTVAGLSVTAAGAATVSGAEVSRVTRVSWVAWVS